MEEANILIRASKDYLYDSFIYISRQYCWSFYQPQLYSTLTCNSGLYAIFNTQIEIACNIVRSSRQADLSELWKRASVPKTRRMVCVSFYHLILTKRWYVQNLQYRCYQIIRFYIFKMWSVWLGHFTLNFLPRSNVVGLLCKAYIVSF